MSVPPPELFEYIGRLKGYRGDFTGAISTFTAGIGHHPADPRLYRHRGHRHLNLRQLTEARQDFRRSLERMDGFADSRELGQERVLEQLEQLVLGGPAVTADGGYSASLPFKVHYHLALTEHFLGDDTEAVRQFEAALQDADTTDLHVAVANWLVVLYGYTGQQERAAELLQGISFTGQAGVNRFYQELLRLYRGELSAEDLLERASSEPRELATSGYGLASWLLFQGRQQQAVELLQRVIREGDAAAFGTIAAEIRLQNL